jgi:DNA phosphorothioation-dependent restriction protein DptH
MKIFIQTLYDYLEENCRRVVIKRQKGRELRIFLSSFPPEVVYEVGQKILEFLSKGEKTPQIVFKVGTGLWETWQQNSKVSRQTLKKIEDAGWVDTQDRLTYYRNLKLDHSSGKDSLIIILIGVEQATDQASLADFFILDSARIWTDILKKKFDAWIEGKLNDAKVEIERKHIRDMDELLRLLYIHHAGDLLLISDFLDSLNLSGAFTSYDVLEIMYHGLPFCNLPMIRPKSGGRKKWLPYVRSAIEFFGYKKYLKESERKKALKKIEQYRKHVEDTGEEPELCAVFDDAEELLDSLRHYIVKNDPEAKKRLLSYDFRIIKDEILEYKEPNDRKKKNGKPPAEREVKGQPLEMILSALWSAMAEFKAKCDKAKKIPADVLDTIELKGRTYTRDTGSEEDAFALLKGCFGGIEDFLSYYLSSFELEKDGETDPLSLQSELVHDELEMKRTNTGKAKFQFEIIFHADGELRTTNKFKCMISDTHPFRTFWHLAKELQEKIAEEKENDPRPFLPICHIPYYKEIFHAPDEEEINRVINMGIKNLTVVNLLDMPTLRQSGEAGHLTVALCESFYQFLKALVNDGYFKALKERWRDLQEKTEEIFNRLIGPEADDAEKEIAPLIYKAFLLTEAPQIEDRESFVWTKSLRSALITPLHPAMIEMLYHQAIFLIEGWIEQMRTGLQENSKSKLRPREWEDVRDLTGISYPLFGFMNDNRNLETRIEPFGLVHRMGEPADNRETLATKIIQRYEAPEDDDFTDTVMFQLNREAKLIAHLLDVYTKIYPYANDGLSIAALNIRNVQSVISGLDLFLSKKLKRDKTDAETYPPYQLNLCVFTHMAEGPEIARWLNEWQKRWDPAHGRKQYDYYQNCRLSVTHKVVRGRGDYIKLLSSMQIPLDIAILTRFMDAEIQGSDVERISAYEKPDWQQPMKFPIVEMPRCADERQANRDLRGRVISNRRFAVATLHSELSARFRNPDTPPGNQHVVISQGNFSPWRKIIDQLHERSAWVLCIDPCVDERLIEKPEGAAGGHRRRDIIGFSSGVGDHGELNYTISTESATLSDIKKKADIRIQQIFGLMSPDSENAGDLLVDRARKLSGLPLIKAITGKDERIRDLIAYALVRHSLPEISGAGDFLCDELISLDAYRHWFRNFDDDSRQYPDLIRITAHLHESGQIHIETHLFECKLVGWQRRHTVAEEAGQQLENGLQHLVRRFCPRQGPMSLRYDQRFWWAQLQRIIANKAAVKSHRTPETTAALERLGSGEFSINWNASVLIIWSDIPKENALQPVRFHVDRTMDLVVEGISFSIPVIQCDGELIRTMANRDESFILPCNIGPRLGGAPAKQAGSGKAERPALASPNSEGGESGPGEVNPEAPDTENEAPRESSAETPTPELESETETRPNPHSAASEPHTPQRVPERILLGRTDQGREIFWEFGHPKLTNRHLLIFGKSGVGKTYAIQTLLHELGRAGQNTVIIDYTEGFLPNQLDPSFRAAANPATFLVRQQPLPINPFRKQVKIIEGFDPILDNSHTVAGRVASVFNAVYATIGEQQRAVLVETIAEGLNQNGDGYDFNMLLSELKEKGSSAVALANKISALVHENLFSGDQNGNWESLYGDASRRVSVLQLSGVNRDNARIATEFILWDLYDYAASSGRKDRPLPVVLDEIQNLDHRLDSPLGKSLTEGRKFGLSLILATQTLSNLKPDERDRLFQASHKLFFKPAETEVREYAKIMEQSAGGRGIDGWIALLNGLNQGECYSLGPCFNPGTERLETRALKIRITSFEDRMNREDNG